MAYRLLVTILSVVFFISACAQQPQALNESAAPAGAQPASALAGGSGGGSSSDSNGGVQNDLGTVSPSDNQGITSPGDGGIDNNGDVASGGSAGGNEPGSAAGSNPTGDPAAGSATSPIQWSDYQDTTLGFSLSIPSLYIPLKEPTSLADVNTNLLGRLRLLEPDLANSDFAEMEPPKFSVEVYSNVQALSLEDWLSTNTSDGDLESVQVDGVDCQKITLKIQLAPNQFIFCDHDNRVYKLIPLGPESEKILASFKFTSP